MTAVSMGTTCPVSSNFSPANALSSYEILHSRSEVRSTFVRYFVAIGRLEADLCPSWTIEPFFARKALSIADVIVLARLTYFVKFPRVRLITVSEERTKSTVAHTGSRKGTSSTVSAIWFAWITVLSFWTFYTASRSHN